MRKEKEIEEKIKEIKEKIKKIKDENVTLKCEIEKGLIYYKAHEKLEKINKNNKKILELTEKNNLLLWVLGKKSSF